MSFWRGKLSARGPRQEELPGPFPYWFVIRFLFVLAPSLLHLPLMAQKEKTSLLRNTKKFNSPFIALLPVMPVIQFQIIFSLRMRGDGRIDNGVWPVMYIGVFYSFICKDNLSKIGPIRQYY